MSYDLEEWMDHGGPAEASAERIRELMQSELERDTTGLKVRIEDGRITFSHQTAVYLLHR